MVNTDAYYIFTINPQYVCQGEEEINATSLRKRVDCSQRQMNNTAKQAEGKKQLKGGGRGEKKTDCLLG